MKKALLCLCVFLNITTSLAQSVSFESFPQDYQLFGRQQNNYGIVPIKGQVSGGGYSHISVVKSRNNVRVGYQKQALSYQNNSAAFSFSDSIKAELAEYAFTAYGIRSANDSVVLASSRDNVAGDFYIVYGQSNAVNWEVEYDYRNEYCRSFGFSAGSNGDAWGLANSVFPRVGIFSITFQSEIARRHQIPTCMISGALAGASVFDLSGRNHDNPSDFNTAYGVLLSRAEKTGLIPFIKGIFYWQGENEAASEDPLRWLPQFEKLLGYLQMDYPNVEKIYVFQLPLFGGGAYDDRIGEFREQQRTLGDKHPIVQVYAPGGATGWDGFHYHLEGSIELGHELADMTGSIHYGVPQKITSPNFQKAFYSKSDRSEITIVFDDYQTMVWPKDSTYANIEGSSEPYSTYQVKDFFYLNKEWQKLASGRAESNRIIVTLKEVKDDTLIKYLPSKYHYSGLSSAPWVYRGPFLKNTHGFRAMAFHHNPIAPYVDLGKIQLSAEDVTSGVNLTWNSLPLATGYLLERTSNDPQLTKTAWHISKEDQSFIDITVKKGFSYSYRIRGYTDLNESDLSNEATVKKEADPIVLSRDPERTGPIVNVFPNPAKDYVVIESATERIKEAALISIRGQLITTFKTDQQTIHLPLTGIPAGLYLLKIATAEKVVVKKLLIR